MVLASLLMTVMVGMVKLARVELSPLQVVFWRAAFSLPLALGVAWRSGLAIRNGRAMALRCGFGFLAMTFSFTAARGLSLADLAIIAKLRPILVTVLAPLLLGALERERPLVWVALVGGLAGGFLIVGPDLAVGSTYGLWALAGTALSALAHVMVRLLGRTDNPRAVVFWFQATVVALASVTIGVVPAAEWQWPPTQLWVPLLVCGLAATGAQLLMTRAYQLDRAAPVATAAYAGPIFSVIGDVVAFGVLPGPKVLLGGLLVVGSGLLIVLLRPAPHPKPAQAPGAE